MSLHKLEMRFKALGTWVRGDRRALHKPLLGLYALGRWQRGKAGGIAYPEVELALTALLKEFGPSRQSFHPECPFWRLQRDRVWEVRSDGPMASNSDPRKSVLIAKHARGGLTHEDRNALAHQPNLAAKIAMQLLERHFPKSRHLDILQAVGISLEPPPDRNRDP
jgi:putative restriction endonuclease